MPRCCLHNIDYEELCTTSESVLQQHALINAIYAGTPFRTPSGQEGLLTLVQVGSEYVDAGAVATDERTAEPGVIIDLTDGIIVSGVDEIWTGAPTPANAPFTIT